MAADIYAAIKERLKLRTTSKRESARVRARERESESKVHFHNRVKYLAECLFRNFQWFRLPPSLPPLHARELK